MNQGEGLLFGQRHQIQPRFGNDSQRPFGSTDQSGQVKRCLPVVPIADPPHQAIQVVAAATAPVAGRIPANDIGMAGNQLVDGPVNPAFQSRSLLVKGQCFFRYVSKPGPSAVTENYVKIQHVLNRHTVKNGMGTGGIVGDDPSHGRPIAAGRVRTVLKSKRA